MCYMYACRYMWLCACGCMYVCMYGYTDFSPYSQFAPFFSETFRPPPHKWERRFAPVFIVKKDVSHQNHISERRFAPKPYFRKTFRTQTIFQKDVSHPNHISERFFAVQVEMPHCQLRCCVFHWTQAVCRKVQFLGSCCCFRNCVQLTIG